MSTPRIRSTARRSSPRVGPLAAKPHGAPVLDVDGLLADRGVGIVVCCGSGGVGKTTTSAALALRAAEQGRRVVVLTIDPARRLAQSMGLTELDNTPRPVQGVDRSNGGSLDAMMLDMKRTFDEVVEAHASPEKARQILANPFYQAVSSSFAGTQEYMAMEKLGQLHAEAQGPGGHGRWDLIVVDTPPSRSALDFLDAPERLASLLDGRFIRLMTAPARGPAKLFSAGLGVVTGALSKVLGAQMLRDAQTFIAALDTLFGGFRARAERTYRLLQADETAFVVVASPGADALREAAYFVERLAADHMPLAGLVVNRVTRTHADDLEETTAAAAAQRLRERGEHPVTAHLLQLHAERMRAVAHEEHLRRRFTAAHPGVPVAEVPALPTDVHDLEGLRAVGEALAGPAAAESA
jgi:anion-transporting  ArsA/GET3 family ATPase